MFAFLYFFLQFLYISFFKFPYDATLHVNVEGEGASIPQFAQFPKIATKLPSSLRGRASDVKPYFAKYFVFQNQQIFHRETQIVSYSPKHWRFILEIGFLKDSPFCPKRFIVFKTIHCNFDLVSILFCQRKRKLIFIKNHLWRMCDVYSVLQTDQITLGVWPNNLAKPLSKLFFFFLLFFVYSENNLSTNIYFLPGIIRLLIKKEAVLSRDVRSNIFQRDFD